MAIKQITMIKGAIMIGVTVAAMPSGTNTPTARIAIGIPITIATTMPTRNTNAVAGSKIGRPGKLYSHSGSP